MWCLLGLVFAGIVAAVFIGLYVSELSKQINAPPDVMQHHIITFQKPFIEHAYYINLDTRPDRKYHIESQLKRVDIPFTRIPGIKDKFGSLGCSKAHLQALESFQKSDHTIALIIEDDSVFAGNKEFIQTQLAKFQNMHWQFDVLLLAGVIQVSEPCDEDFVRRVKDAQTTAAYVVHRRFLSILMQNIKDGIALLEQQTQTTHDYCIDIYWKRLQSTNRWFAMNPLLVYQRADFSDIEQHDVNYVQPLLTKQNQRLEYIICIKTCQPRYKQNTKQLEALEQICNSKKIKCFFYMGTNDRAQTEMICYDEDTFIFPCKDDYLHLCRKLGCMIRFLHMYIQTNRNCQFLKGIFFTDDDITLHPEHFYEYLEENKDIMYWGKTATYPETDNFSNHLIERAQQNFRFHDDLEQHYPLLLQYPIHVPKVTFCAGGGFYLRSDMLRYLVQEDEHFMPFPESQDLKFHLKSDALYSLHVFDDTEVAICLQKYNVFATHLDLKIAEW